MFIKKIFRNYVPKCNLYLYFLIQQNLLIPGEKLLMSVEIKMCVMWFIYSLNLFYVRYSCAKLHRCRICVTDFRERRDFCHPSPPPNSWRDPNKSFLKGVNVNPSSSSGFFTYLFGLILICNIFQSAQFSFNNLE